MKMKKKKMMRGWVIQVKHILPILKKTFKHGKYFLCVKQRLNSRGNPANQEYYYFHFKIKMMCKRLSDILGFAQLLSRWKIALRWY